MKKLNKVFKIIATYPMLFVFLVCCLIFLPEVITMDSLAFRASIAVGLGVEKTGDMLTTYAVVNVPANQQNSLELDKLIVGQGKTFSEAIDSMSNMIGKKILYGHMRIIFLGESLKDENIAELLNPLIRTKKLRDTVAMVYCNGKIKEIMQMGIKLKTSTGFGITEMVGYNLKHSTSNIISNIDSFYKGYFSKSNCAFLDSIAITQDENQGISDDVGSNDASGGEQDSSKNNKYIQNMGEVAVFKDGKFQLKLNSQQTIGLNWLTEGFFPTKIKCKNVNVKNLKNATLVFELYNKQLSCSCLVKNGVPIYDCKINLVLDLAEVQDSSNNSFEIQDIVIDNNIIKELNKTIKTEFSLPYNQLKNSGIDALNLYSKFEREFFRINNISLVPNMSEFLKIAQIQIDVQAQMR